MNYVAGFMFSTDRTRVALIRKNKPEWQKGLLNGIGGKVENDELFHSAMAREFEEETGVTTHPMDWNNFALIGGEGWTVNFFATYGSVDALESPEEEKVELVEVASIHPLRAGMIENLPWLIALAVDALTDGRPRYAKVEYPA